MEPPARVDTDPPKKTLESAFTAVSGKKFPKSRFLCCSSDQHVQTAHKLLFVSGGLMTKLFNVVMQKLKSNPKSQCPLAFTAEEEESHQKYFDLFQILIDQYRTWFKSLNEEQNEEQVESLFADGPHVKHINDVFKKRHLDNRQKAVPEECDTLYFTLSFSIDCLDSLVKIIKQVGHKYVDEGATIKWNTFSQVSLQRWTKEVMQSETNFTKNRFAK